VRAYGAPRRLSSPRTPTPTSPIATNIRPEGGPDLSGAGQNPGIQNPPQIWSGTVERMAEAAAIRSMAGGAYREASGSVNGGAKAKRPPNSGFGGRLSR